MAALIGTYDFDFQRSVPTTGVTGTEENSRAVLWTLVHQLTGDLSGISGSGLWTCEASSNGYRSTGSYGNSNLWWNGGVFDKTLMMNGRGDNATAAGAWMVLYQAALGLRLLFVLGPPQSGLGNWSDVQVYASYQPFTGGTLAVVPSSPVQMVWTTPGTAQAAWSIMHDHGSDTMTRKAHLALADDGAFFWGSHPDGYARICNGLMVAKMEDKIPGDTRDALVCYMANAYDTYYIDRYPSSSYYKASAWSLGGLVADRLYNYAGTTMRMINPQGTAAGQAWPAFTLALTPAVQVSSVGAYQLGLPHTAGLDANRQLYPEFPVYVLGPGGVRGRIRDLWHCYPFTEGTVDPSGAGPIKRVCWGDFMVPSPDAIFTF